MFECGEDLPFFDETAHAMFVGGAPTGQELEGDALSILVVGAFGEVHRAHAAAADQSDNAVWSNARSRRDLVQFRGELLDQRYRENRRGAIERGRRFTVREQRREL